MWYTAYKQQIVWMAIEMPVNSFEHYPMSWTPARAALGPGPVYLALAAALERDIASGALPPGTRLPPQRELADFLDVNFTTVTRAYDLCREKHLIYGVTGRGTFVAALPGVDDGVDAEAVFDLGVVQAFPEIGARTVVEAAQRVLARESAERLFSYRDRDGLARHRAAGRHWLARRGVTASDGNIAIFPGVQSALSTVLLSVFQVGDAVATDPFTYANLIQLARLARVRLVPVGGDGDGMRPEALDAVARRQGVKGVFLMPNGANPTAATMSDTRRDELAAVARRRGLLVLEDDASLVPSARRALFARLPEQTVYLSGSTRLVAPGLRSACIAFPASTRDRMLAGLHHLAIKASALDTEIMAELVLSGVAEEVLRQKAKRAAEANRIFGQAFPAQAGGDAQALFRTVPLPGTAGRGPEVEREFLARGLRVCHSDRFHVGNGADAPFLRVSLSSCGSTVQLKRALALLAETVLYQNG